MKLLIASDIHGSVYYTKKVLDIFNAEKFDHLVLLGDILYHGARNPLPKEYNPVEVTTLLNSFRNKIIAIKGNCDSEVDEMVLEFMLVPSSVLFIENKKIFLTHGHVYNHDVLPKNIDVMFYGHYHVPRLEVINNLLICNPGSISLPKNNSKNSYAILTENEITIKSFDDEVIFSKKLT